MLDVSNRSRVDVARVEQDSRALLTALSRMLVELGHADAARVLPRVGDEAAVAPQISSARDLAALTIGVHLVNFAEQRASAIHREEARSRGLGESGLWASTIAELRDRPGLLDALGDLDAIVVEPVFTAHPTEARRISALEQWLSLGDALGDGEIVPDQENLAVRLERLVRTGEVRLRKPSIADERDVVVHTLVKVVAPAIAQVSAITEEALGTLGARSAPRLRFGTWVGGDRDGHPGVTAEVTAESLAAYRRAAIALHRENLVALARKLSISSLTTEVPAVLAEHIVATAAALGARSGRALERNPEEPFRELVTLVLERLPDEGAPAQDGCYRSARALEDDLVALHRALVSAGAARIARADVAPVLAQVRAFGFHLVRLDLRQNSAVHDRAMESLLRNASSSPGDVAFAAWDCARRRALLLAELESARPFAAPGAPLDPAADVAVAPLRVAAARLATHGDPEMRGEHGIGSFIVSMTRDETDLFVPYLLAREAGLWVPTDEGPACPIGIVPLFETEADLERAPAVMDAYFAQPIVRRSLALRAAPGEPPSQDIMVGYSDSNKDAGPCASLWAVHVAQRELLRVAERHGVRARFFHGRGGSASRGAGPTFRFLSALPTGALSLGLRMTEQGETVSQKYGTVESAAYNLELLLAGSVRKRALDRLGLDRPADEARLEAALAHVASASRNAYREFFHADGLLRFFREATPVDVIEQSGIGSRPARRTGQPTLEDLRAIPWVFAWSQSRFALTGWFGLGAGMESLARSDPGAFRALTGRALGWPPLRYIVGNASVSVMSVDEPMMELYAELVGDEALRARTMRVIRDELERTRRMLEIVYGGPLSIARGRIHALLAMRTEALRRANRRQVELLRGWREGDRRDDALRVELLATVNAIAAGLRTTG